MNTSSTLLSKDDVSWFCWDDSSNDGKTSNGGEKTCSTSYMMSAPSKISSPHDTVGACYPATISSTSRSNRIINSNPNCFAEDTTAKLYYHQHYHQQYSNPYSCSYQHHQHQYGDPRSAPSTYQQEEEYHQQQHSYYNSSSIDNNDSTMMPKAATNPGSSMVCPSYYQWQAAPPPPALTRSTVSTTSNQAQNTFDASFWHDGEQQAMVSPYTTTSGDFADYSYHSRLQNQRRRVSQTSSLYSYGDKIEEKQPKRKLKKARKVADDEPRRPLSAYNFFFSEEKEIVVALLPGKQEENATDAGDIQLCDMDVEKIQEYLIKAKRNLSTEALDALSETIERQTERTLLAHLEGDKPKKSHTKSHGKISFQKLASVIGRRWRDLSDDDKKRYFALRKADQDRFKKQLEERRLVLE